MISTQEDQESGIRQEPGAAGSVQGDRGGSWTRDDWVGNEGEAEANAVGYGGNLDQKEAKEEREDSRGNVGVVEDGSFREALTPPRP